MFDPSNITKLRSLQKQDEAHAVAWLAGEGLAEWSRIWDAIQMQADRPVENDAGHAIHMIARFAQLGMTHAILLAIGRMTESN